MSKRKTRPLKDLIDQIDWIKITPGRGSRKLPDNKVAVSFVSSKKNSQNIDRVIIRLGKSVLEKLKWESGDKIYFSVNPDNYTQFLCTKNNGGVGYKLSQDNGLPSCYFKPKWNQDFKLKRMSHKYVNYEIHKKQLIFEVN